MKKQFVIGVIIATLAVLGVACSDSTESNVNANANTGDTAATTTTAPDNSEVTTTTDNAGVKTQTRIFRNNPRVSKVVVTTRNGVRTVKVYSPSGEEKELNKNEPEDWLEATGDHIADAAGWVKDKSVTAYDKTKEGAKTVADKTVDTTKTVADKTVDTTRTVADKTVDTSKTVGRKTAAGAKTVANKTTQAAKKTGNAIKKVIVP